MEKKIEIIVWADIKKFNQKMDKLKTQAKKLHSDLNSLSDWIDTSWLDKLDNKVKEVWTTADRSKNKVEDIWKSVNVNWINKLDSKLNNVKGTAKNLRSEIWEKHELKLKVDGYEMQLLSAKRKLKTLKSDTEEAQRLRLDISDYKANLWKARYELTNFVRRGKKELSGLQQHFNTIGWNMKGMIWWAMATAGWMMLENAVVTSEVFQRNLVLEGTSADDARGLVSNLQGVSAQKGSNEELYFKAYQLATKGGVIWREDVNSDILTKAAIVEERGGDMKQFLNSLKTIKESWWAKGVSYEKISREIVGLLSTNWVMDVQSDIPELIAEYMPVLTERWYSRADIYKIIETWSKKWVFNLDKPLDFAKEAAGAKISDMFSSWKEWDLEKLNKVFWEDFKQLREDYKEWHITWKDVVWQLLDKWKSLTGAKAMEFQLDILGTQAEDMWLSQTTEIFDSLKWLDKEKYLDTLSSRWNKVSDNLQELSGQTYTGVKRKVWVAGVSILNESIKGYSKMKDDFINSKMFSWEKERQDKKELMKYLDENKFEVNWENVNLGGEKEKEKTTVNNNYNSTNTPREIERSIKEWKDLSAN